MGNYNTEIDRKEHEGDANVFLKKVGKYVWDSDNLVWVKANGDSSGNGKVIITDGTNDADVIPTNGHFGLVAIAPGHVSTDNSTSTPLGIDGVFTGEWEDITNFGVIMINAIASHDSAVDGLRIEFSSDGTNIDNTDTFSLFANDGNTTSVQASTKYFRIVYTNGSTEQTYFRLQVTLKPYYVKPSSHRIKDEISGENDAELVKAVLTGENPQGTFVDFQATTAGNFKVSLEEYDETFETNPLPTKISVGDEKRNITYEDTSFVTGDSPIVLDIATDLSRTGIDGYIVNDGGGDIQVEVSNDGTNYGSVTTLKDADVYDLDGITISKIRLTWVADTTYRVNVI